MGLEQLHRRMYHFVSVGTAGTRTPNVWQNSEVGKGGVGGGAMRTKRCQLLL